MKILMVFLCSDRNAEQQRILWKIPDISQKSENGGKMHRVVMWIFFKE